MEQFSMDSRPETRRKWRMISLRKYSLAICVLEAAVIGLFIYLLLRGGRQSQQASIENGQLIGGDTQRTGSVGYLIFTDKQSQRSVALLPGLFETCTLRKYDFQRASVCHSSNWTMCDPVEGSASHVIRAQEEQNWSGHMATVISTTKQGRRLSKEFVKLQRIECKPQLDAHQDSCRFSTRLLIQTHQRKQSIIGWGGALTDSSIQNILALSTNGTRRLLDDYFGPDGLRYNMIRITIGGSDFSERFYTNDDSPADDFKLEQFRLREEDNLYKVPMLKMIKNEYAAQWQQPAGHWPKVFASMWSPPLWMKTNRHHNKGQLKGSINSEQYSKTPPEERYYEALAELKIKFLLAYQRETGLKFWGLTVMNEPQFSVQPFLNFNTMIFPREDYANYVAKYLGPKLKQQNKKELGKVMLIAHDDNRRYVTNFTMPIMANSRVRQYIDGVATHSYVDEAYDQLDLLYETHHHSERDFFVLPTELSSGHLPFMDKALIGDWGRGMHYALDIVRSLKHSAAGWVDWNMVLDTSGGPGWLDGRLDAPIIVDKQHDVYYKSPMFYVLGQFSRYIPPGSVKLQTVVHNDHFDNHFEVVSFELPGGEQFATVVVNNNPYPIEIKFKIQTEQKAPISNSYYVCSCQADSVSTILYSKTLLG